MTCLIKSRYKEELSKYADIVGSEEGAYYLLAMNNGYTLDKNPDGSVSELYDALMQKNNGDEVMSILDKAVVYTPDYISQNGDWTEGFNAEEGSLEPSITTLFNDQGQPLCDNDAVRTILKDEQTINQLVQCERNNMLERDITLNSRFAEVRKQYVEDHIQDYQNDNPNATPAEIADERVRLANEFDRDEIDDAVFYIERELFNQFEDVTEVNGQYVGEGEVGELRAALLNSLHDRYNTYGTAILREEETVLPVLDLLRTQLMGLDPELSITPMVKAYIKLFGNTRVIQEAIDAVKKVSPKKSTESIINEIAEYVTGRIKEDPKKQKFHRAIETFWGKFKNLLRRMFFKPRKDYNTRRNALDAITLYFAANENLADNDNFQLIMDIYRWSIDGKETNVKSRDVIKNIKKGLQARLKSIDSLSKEKVNTKERNDITQWLDDIQQMYSRDKNIEDGEKALISKFLNTALQEISEVLNVILNIRDQDVSKINAQQMIDIKQNIIGFYHNILISYIIPYTYTTEDEEFKQGGSVYQTIMVLDNILSRIQHAFNEQLLRYCDYVCDEYVDNYVDVGNKERYRLNMKRYLRNQIGNGELAFFEKFASGANQQSSVIRMLDYRLRDIFNTAHKESQDRGKQLWSLWKNSKFRNSSLNPFNAFRKIMEVDEDGVPTGNFVAPVNVGMCEKRLNKEIQRLDKEFGVTLDEDGRKVWKDEEQWKEYMDALDTAKERIGIHRRYKAQYYIDRRRFLDRDVIETISTIQRAIDRLYQNCTKTIILNGEEVKVPVVQDLTKPQLIKLNQLLKQKQDISNPYEIVYDPNTGNIVSLKEKEGRDLEVALQIIRWNAYKRGKIKTTSNEEAYKKAEAALIQEYGENSKQVETFRYNNRVVTFSKGYQDELTDIFGVGSAGEVVDELRARKRAILNATMGKKGYYEPDLSKLSDQAWIELKRIDEELSQHKSEIHITPEDFERLNEIQADYQVKRKGTDVSYYNWLQQQYLNNPQEFMNKYCYYNHEKQKWYPLSCFSYKGPRKKSDVVDIASGAYSDFSEDSYYSDEKFDTADPSFVQVDKEMYKNEQYDKVKDDPFYKLIISTMEEIWSLLGLSKTMYKYQMPQIRSANNKLLFRKHVWSSTKAMFNNTFYVNERDTEFNEDFSVRPDGSIVETIPMRWINKLDDPSIISTNIIQSVSQMYEMAIQYSKKSELVPVMELMQFQLYGGYDRNVNVSTDQADRFAKHMQMYMYGRRKTGLNPNKKISAVEKSLIKIFSNIMRITHSKLMTHNLVSVSKNAIDSSASLWAEVGYGKYFDESDFNAALKLTGYELFKGGPIKDVGTINPFSMTSALMDYNGVSGKIDELFEGADMSWARRVFHKHGSMGEYTAVDYMFKGMVTEMVYHSYRLLTDPNTGKQEFVNKDRARYMYLKVGYTEEDGQHAYEEASVTLRDAYYKDKNGSVKIKPEYLDIVKPVINEETGRRSNKVENRITGTITERCSVINGMLDEMDKSVLTQNWVGALIFLMRGWMISQQVDYNKRGHDFAIFSDEPVTQNKSQANKFKDLVYNRTIDAASLQIVEEDEPLFFNNATGTLDKGAWVGLISAYKNWIKAGAFFRRLSRDNKLTRQQIYQVRRMNMCVLSVMMLSLMTGIFGALWEGDPNNWIYAYLYTNSIATVSERSTQIGYGGFVYTLADLVQTPTVVTAYANDLHYIPEALKDAVAMTYDWATDGQGEIEAYEKVRGGSYSGLRKWQRAFLQASSEIPDLNELGINNIFKTFYIPAMHEKAKWYSQIQPTPTVGYKVGLTKPKKQVGLWGLIANDPTKQYDESEPTVIDLLHGPDYEPKSSQKSSGKKKKKIKTTPIN